jgi:hypothetical protein
MMVVGKYNNQLKVKAVMTTATSTAVMATVMARVATIN